MSGDVQHMDVGPIAESVEQTQPTETARAEAAEVDAARAEATQSGTEMRFQPLLDRGPPMYVADPDGDLQYCNAAFQRFLSTGKASTQAELKNVFKRLKSGDMEITTRHRVTLAEGVRHYRATHFRTVEDGEPTGFAGTYADITQEILAAQRSADSEARFQDVIRSTSDWVWETDANLNLTYLSERITEVLELPPQALNGRYLFSLGEFEALLGGETTRPDLASELAPFRGRIFLMRDSRDRERRIAMSGVPVFEETTGKFVGYRGTGTDVTSRYEAEQRAQRSQHQLEISLRALQERNQQLDVALHEAHSAVKAKTEFLGKMSHELRTPLNAIIGFSEMSIQQVFGSMNERYLNYFRDIRNAAQHLLHIINDILDAANVDSSEMSVSCRPVQLAEVIDEARSIVSIRAEQGGVDLSNVRMDEDWVVMADPGRVRQIFVNLLSNAVKFTESQGKVGVDLERDEDDVLHVTVWDTGVGIPEHELDRIFDSFHQVDSNVLVTSQEGTGLGLTISRQLARMMGGDLLAESHLGQGSRFTVKLPLVLQMAAAGE